MIELGTDPKAITDRLGHKSVRTVLDVYGHLYEGTDPKIAAQIDGLLAGDGADVVRLHAD